MKKMLSLLIVLIIISTLFVLPCQASDGSSDFNLVIALVVGISVGLISVIVTVIIVVYTYKKKLKSEKYPLNRYSTLDLTDQRDIFTGSFVTRRRINNNNNKR